MHPGSEPSFSPLPKRDSKLAAPGRLKSRATTKFPSFERLLYFSCFKNEMSALLMSFEVESYPAKYFKTRLSEHTHTKRKSS